MNLYLSVAILLLSVACSNDFPLRFTQEPFNLEASSIEPELITRLSPVDTNSPTDNSGNLIQGLSAFENKWLVSQDAGGGYILFNILNEVGVSIFNRQVSVDSLGQDLSYIENGDELKVFSALPDHLGSGISEFSIKPLKNKAAFSRHYIIPNLSNFHRSTPSISTDKKYFVIRASEIGNSQNDKVYIYSTESIFNEDYETEHSFNLHEDQTVSEQWFQGIAMDDNKVYTLTGNGNLDTDKILMVYSLSGEVLFKKIITAGKKIAKNEGDRWEPEGLSIKGNHLYFTINSGRVGSYIKRLYKMRIK